MEGRGGLLLSGWGLEGATCRSSPLAQGPSAAGPRPGLDGTLVLLSPHHLVSRTTERQEEERAGLRSPHPRLASVAVSGCLPCKSTQVHTANVHTWVPTHTLPRKLLSNHGPFQSKK